MTASHPACSPKSHLVFLAEAPDPIVSLTSFFFIIIKYIIKNILFINKLLIIVRTRRLSYHWVFFWEIIIIITWIFIIIISVASSAVHCAIHLSHDYSSAWHVALHKMPGRWTSKHLFYLKILFCTFLFWHPSGGMKLPSVQTLESLAVFQYKDPSC